MNHDLGRQWVAYSAGTAPAGYIHPLAIEVMAELGIDIRAGRSKPADEFRRYPLDRVITVCDDAAENCPLWLGPGRVSHISFPDPAKASGSREEQLLVFRQVRDDIRRQVIPFLQGFA